MDPNVHQEMFAKIEGLRQEKKYTEALFFCQNIINIDPSNKKALILFNDLKNEYWQDKDALIRKTIQESRELWDKKDYHALQKIYNELSKVYPHHPEIDQGLEKIEKAKLHETENSVEDLYESGKKLYKQKKYEESIKTLNLIFSVDPHHKNAADLIAKARIKYVDQKLKLATPLVKSGDINSLRNFYLKLYEVTPEYEKIRLLLGKCETKLNKQKKDAQNDFIYKSLPSIQQKINQGKFSKAIEECQELLKLNPDNKKLKELLKFISKKETKLINQELLEQIIKGQNKIKEEYQLDKAKFIKL